MYLAIMGIFNLFPPNLCDNVAMIHVISYVAITSMKKVSQFKTSYFEYPWVIPEPTQGDECREVVVFMSTSEIDYPTRYLEKENNDN